MTWTSGTRNNRKGAGNRPHLKRGADNIKGTETHKPIDKEHKMSTWRVTMNRFGTKYDLERGFASEQEAIDFAESMDWRYADENGFEWSLEVEEDAE